MGSHSIAASVLGAEGVEVLMDGVDHIVGVEVSEFANSACVNCCFVVALGGQDMGLASTLSDPKMVAPKVEVAVEVAVRSSWNCSHDEEVDAYAGLPVCDLGQLFCLCGRWMMMAAVGGRTKS